MSTPSKQDDDRLFARMPDWLKKSWKGVRKELREKDRYEFWRRNNPGSDAKYGK